MGENEGWVQPSGIFPNGLLPNAAPAIRVLESERWLKVEERTAELIACIQPNQPSEERRNAVADYVQRLITKCFHCKVFTFGSVPLKTYLPDGDIDLTAVSDNQNLKETWAIEVRDMLENEEKDENAEFRVKEVQYIQAEVKIIKCLVENIVVDISFNQVGGLCTLCFLEEVDHLISQNHLFKRSIILIKAWCYYESRILGAHHGLISTYALETLVLYIFHVFNNCFAGPLEVLYRFLEFFSNFDWDNFCVSLWGPVHISSLPDVAAEPPRRDSGELLLSKLFLDACSSVYTVFPGGQENQGQPFVSKHFNVIDPLRVNNNLGRSVSKGNFYRIRSAFAFGAKKLARLLDCPKENLFLELNQFFMNTWDRHGSGVRPDAPTVDSRLLRSSPQGNPPGSDNSKVTKVYHNSSSRETKVEGTRTQSLKSYGNLNSQHVTGTDKNQEKLQSENLLNDIQGRFLFARTRSSPELTDTYGDVSSYERHNRAPYNVKAQATSAGSNNYNRHRRKNPGPGPEPSPSHSGRSTSDDLTSHQKVDCAAGSNSGSNTNHLESGPRVMEDGHSFAVGTQGMHQDEQDIVNMMASSTINGFKGQVHTPLNLAAGHLPFPISPSILASMGYGQRNFAGMIPTNFPLIDHSFSNMQFPHGLVPPQLSHYFSGVGGSTNSEGSIDTGNENVGTMEMNSEEADHEYWEERDIGSTGGFDSDAGNIEMLHADDKPQSTSVSFNYAPPSRVSRPGSSVRGQQKYSLEKRGTMLEDNLDNFRIHENQCNEVYSDERTTSSRFSSAAHSSSIRSKTSSESSWEEPSTKVSKSTREKRGKNSITSEPPVIYGKGKTTSDHESVQPEKDEQDWNHPRNMSTDIAERNSRTLSVSSLNMVRHHLPSYESAQTSGSEPMIHMSPMVLGPGSQQRMMDNNGVVPFAFYLTGPPVPFLAMLPVYNVPPKAGTSDTSTSLYGGEEGIDNNDPGESFDSSEGHDQSGDSNNANSLRSASFEISDDHKSDILNSDFASHWQNLQYGRFCQNPRPHGPMDYPSPVMVPPLYLQGRAPWEGPGRPLSGNMNIFTQLMNYGPRLVPVSPIQSLPTRPPNVYQRYADDLPRYRTGTGTYLPNPKVPVRDRHPSGTRRGNYNYDRSDNNGEREGNWRSRNSGRNHNRNQAEKSSPRHDRLAASESRPDRSWNSYRQDSYPSYQSQNGPLHSNSSHGGPTDVAYGMYSVPAMDSGGLSSNGPTAPSVVMMYPYDHNPNYASHAEQLEFGSLGPVGFSGMNEQLHSSEGGRARGVYEEHRFQRSPVHQSSPDQPSSPHHHNGRV